MSIKTTYVNHSEINELQIKIMQAIDIWAHEQKTPIPLKEIIYRMTMQGIKDFTTIKALKVLLNKGYIRRSSEISNKSAFVQLRRV